MNEIIITILLGIAQGVAEMMPISSSAHITIAEHLMQFNKHYVIDTLHMGSMLVLIFFYRRALLAELIYVFKERKFSPLSIKIIISLLPAAIMGLLDRKVLHISSHSLDAIGIAMICSGLLALFVDMMVPREPRINSIAEIKYRDSIIIGIIQVLAVFPGMSRLGLTLVGCRLLRIEISIGLMFSFLMAIPIMALTSAHDFLEYTLASIDLHLVAIGIITAMVASSLTIRPVLHFLTKPGSLTFFGYYRIIFGITLYTMMNI